jgi:hypothetical protein
LARINAQLARTPNIACHHTSLLDSIDGGFDLIIADPLTCSIRPNAPIAMAAARTAKRSR